MGSRHLQALALLNDAVKIYVVDPNYNSLQTAKQRYEQIEGYTRHEIHFLENYHEINETHIALAIVATNSEIRSLIISNLTQKFSIDFLLLEKFLFPRREDYVQIGKLLTSFQIKTFVNCPRRMFSDYRAIKEAVALEETVRIEVIGNNWGLGCNGIHFIDLFQWLVGESIIKWHNELNPGFISSKRDGYVEFCGSLYGSSENNHKLSITCYRYGVPNISVRISSPSQRFIVSEGVKKIYAEEISNQKQDSNEFDYKPNFQSQLTNKVADQLFTTGDCQLTPFAASVDAHLPFFETLLQHYNNYVEYKTDFCPIT